MRSFIYVVFACLVYLLGGCALYQKQVSLASIFNADEARKLMQPGSNIVKGSALIRQNGGGVVTCAGQKVRLLPATSYASERMQYLYGSTERGYNPAGLAGRRFEFSPNSAEYQAINLETICDAQGYFHFNNVGNGTFYIGTGILWQIPGSYFFEGGFLMQRITLSGGETKEIVLAP